MALLLTPRWASTVIKFRFFFISGKRRTIGRWRRFVRRRPDNSVQHQAGAQWKGENLIAVFSLVHKLAARLIFTCRSTPPAAQQQHNTDQTSPAVCGQSHLGTNIHTFPFIEPFVQVTYLSYLHLLLLCTTFPHSPTCLYVLRTDAG